MNETASRIFGGLICAAASIGLAQVASLVSILAGLVALAATLPVAVDRWRHKLPACITRHFPARAP